MSYGSPVLSKKPQRRQPTQAPLSQRPGIILPPPLDASRRPPPIRLAPLTSDPDDYSRPFDPTPASQHTSSNLPPLYSQKAYPKTPTLQMPDPVSVIVNRCLQHPPFHLIEAREVTVLSLRKSHQLGPLGTDLQTLLRVVRSKGLRVTLTNGDYNQLVRMICRYILKPRPPLAVRNPFAESQPMYEITNYPLLDIVHMILQTLLVEPAPVRNFIDRNFVDFLISELDTPVYQEQFHLEAEIRQILDGFPDLVSFVVSGLIARLKEYIDRIGPSFRVGPILGILLSYLEKANAPWADGFYDKTVVPLYFTEYLTDFEKPLRAMTVFFCKRDGSHGQFCLLQMMLHWPRTNPRKEVSFLQQFVLLLSSCPEKSLPKICPKVLQVIAYCVRSENSSVSMSACFMLLDGQFLCLFAPVRDLFALVLVPALRRAAGQGRADQQEMAKNLLSTLGDDGSIADAEEEGTRKAMAVWQGIAKQTGMTLRK
jgi:hypothetical protein